MPGTKRCWYSWWPATAAVMLLAACALLPGPAWSEGTTPLAVKVMQNTHRLMPYQVFELTFQHEEQYRDPTWDVTIEVAFTAPSGKKATVGGFFYGSSKPQQPIVRGTPGTRGYTSVWPCEPADLWKARFAPAELGRWTFAYRFQDPLGWQAAGTGSFEVVKGRVRRKGFLRISPHNPFRFVFDDGSPYFPIGFQDCIFDGNHNGSVLDQMSMEGPFRLDNAAQRPAPPPGALFARGPSMNPQNADVKFGRMARAGFNLWRFSPNNCSIKLFASPQDANRSTLDHVRWEQARMIDELLQMTRKYGFCNFYGIFGYTPVFNDRPQDAAGMAKVKRALKYSVDRWGAYVDVWEFLNEQKADTAWYAQMIPYLKSIDPYGHPITTSWERPELQGIDINAPHWYGNEDERTSDQVTASRVAEHKRHGKPVVYGEQGNSRGSKDRTAEGIGGVWDPGSARRMRVRSWTALFCEAALIFWETSYAKDGHYMNLWIGPEERQYVRVLQDFAGCLDGQVRPAPVELQGAEAAGVRAYGLRSPLAAGAYLHHHRCAQCQAAEHQGRAVHHSWDHDRGVVRGLAVVLDVPQPAKAYWYCPSDGKILGMLDVQPGRQTLAAPPFTVDLALLITNRPLPDTDGDGTPNHHDPDDDNDGVADAQDAWPLEREEWADADADRIGDNLDADIDADGRGDDRNGNGVADCEERDWDNDGIPHAESIPWDAFPRDPKEWRDTDGDGLGDNQDPDDDGDGYSDAEERRANTDPLDPLSFPR